MVGTVHPRRKDVHWKGNEALLDMAIIPKQTGQSDSDIELDGLTAANLERTCCVHLEWTDCLNDHLRLSGIKGKRILHIYQHKRALMNHENAASPLPPALLEESIRSLELLLPFGDQHTRKLLTASGKLPLYPFSSGKHPASNLDEFIYLRPRIKRLLELLHGPPESFLQWLLDTRDIGQLAALWVGICGILLTILVGIIALVYSIRQYLIALESYDLSMKAYQLSLIIACEQNSTILGRICH